MRKKNSSTVIILLLFSLICFSSAAQNTNRDRLLEQIRKGLIIDTKGLKDSIAFYSFSIKIELKKNKNSVVAGNISFNDSIAFKVIHNYSFLKQMNFKPIVMLARQNVLIIPIGVIIANYEEKRIYQHKIPVEDIALRINKLFNYDSSKKDMLENYLYLSPIIIYVDKAIYN